MAEERRIQIESNVHVGEAQAGTTATGVNVGSMGQGGAASVSINIERLIEDPPQTARDYLKSLWLLMLADQLERRERQAETDARQAEAEEHRQQVRAELIALQHRLYLQLAFDLVHALVTLGLLVAVWQIMNRLGWLLGLG